MSNKRSTTLTVSIKAVDEDTKELVEDYSFECESLIMSASNFSNLQSIHEETRKVTTKCEKKSDGCTDDCTTCTQAMGFHTAVLGASTGSTLVKMLNNVTDAVENIPAYAQAKSADEMLKELFNELPEELQFLLKMAAENTEDDLGESSELFDHILRNAPNSSYVN